jgi:hypothetical protein
LPNFTAFGRLRKNYSKIVAKLQYILQYFLIFLDFSRLFRVRQDKNTQTCQILAFSRKSSRMRKKRRSALCLPAKEQNREGKRLDTRTRKKAKVYTRKIKKAA